MDLSIVVAPRFIGNRYGLYYIAYLQQITTIKFNFLIITINVFFLFFKIEKQLFIS